MVSFTVVHVCVVCVGVHVCVCVLCVACVSVHVCACVLSYALTHYIHMCSGGLPSKAYEYVIKARHTHKKTALTLTYVI